MNKIIPYKKDITFLNDIYEISSISLEHNYSIKDNIVEREFIVSGDYIKKLKKKKEAFIYNIPFKTIIDDIYDSSNIKIDIDDFNYKIKDNNVLEVNINLLLDNLIRKEEPIIEDISDERDIPSEEVTSIFNNFSDKDEKYTTYHVHIYRENDDLNRIIEEYKITKEDLFNYNDIDNITIGSKLIIPSNE